MGDATTPGQALETLAAQLRAEDTVISGRVTEPATPPIFAGLVAAGPAATANPAAYALVVECVYEGYLLHYGKPRVVAGADADLALLAGDYLYALGLSRLAGLGDLAAVRELSDLISLAAQLHADRAEPGPAADALWLASVTAIAAGADERLEGAKAALRSGDKDATEALQVAAAAAARDAGISEALGRAANAIESARS